MKKLLTLTILLTTFIQAVEIEVLDMQYDGIGNRYDILCIEGYIFIKEVNIDKSKSSPLVQFMKAEGAFPNVSRPLTCKEWKKQKDK